MTAQREANTVLVPADKLRELQIANANLRAEIEQLKTIHNQTAKDGVAGFNAAIEHNVVLRQQLTISQLEAKRLQEALDVAMENLRPHGDNCFVSDHYEGDPGNRCNCGRDGVINFLIDTLSSPPSTEALDAYVAEKVKEAMK